MHFSFVVVLLIIFLFEKRTDLYILKHVVTTELLFFIESSGLFGMIVVF